VCHHEIAGSSIKERGELLLGGVADVKSDRYGGPIRVLNDFEVQNLRLDVKRCHLVIWHQTDSVVFTVEDCEILSEEWEAKNEEVFFPGIWKFLEQDSTIVILRAAITDPLLLGKRNGGFGSSSSKIN
jgi:hypothetical protein